MKIRLSHVSNSSSASYFLSISGKSLEQVVGDLLCEYTWDYFNREKIVQKIKNRISVIRDSGEFSKQKKDKESKITIDILKSQDEWAKKEIGKLEGFLKIISDSEDDNVAFARAVWDLSGIKVEVKKGKQKKPTIEFSYFTSMHNSFNEGMGDMFSEMVLFCVNEYRAKFWMESDNDDN